MVGGFVGVDAEGVFDIGLGLGCVAFFVGDFGLKGKRIRIVGIEGKHGLGLLGGAVGDAAGHHDVAEIDAGLDVVGVEVDGAHQFLVAGHVGAHLEIDLGQLIVGGSEVVVDLDGV